MEIEGFQISEAVPLNDGSLMTTLVDQYGNTVGTVTRLSDGTTQASVDALPTDTGGFDWSGVLRGVTDFLDRVARSAQQTSDEVTRVSRGIQGAAAGAQAGYGAPLNWKPWAIAGAAVVATLIVVQLVTPSRRR